MIESGKDKDIRLSRLFYAKDSMDAAKKKCKAGGYTPVDSDLNAGTSKNYVVMGYKETEDPADAICSIRLLAMDSGYELKDYDSLQKTYQNSNSAVIDTIEAAANEFAANYKAGSLKAEEAYKGLNLIYVPTDSGDVKLGDYIAAGKADWDFFANVVTRASAGTVNTIISFLSAGIAPYENEIDEETGEDISVSWSEAVKDSPVW